LPKRRANDQDNQRNSQPGIDTRHAEITATRSPEIALYSEMPVKVENNLTIVQRVNFGSNTQKKPYCVCQFKVGNKGVELVSVKQTFATTWIHRQLLSLHSVGAQQQQTITR
jgi:hypothetical protein